MAEEWLYLDTGAGRPGWNMGFDEALLEGANRRGRPVLRFYGWTMSAATFGYFQKFEEVRRLTALRPLVRRPTGGGLVPHDSDWTYSLAFPAGHAWYGLRAVESYRRVHEWLSRAFLVCGVSTALSAERVTEAPGQCFAGAERFDLLWRNRKVAGAAQRRRKDGLLIQGSIQPPAGMDRKSWQDAMLHASANNWGVTWSAMEADQFPARRAEALAREKFETDAFNQRR